MKARNSCYYYGEPGLQGTRSPTENWHPELCSVYADTGKSDSKGKQIVTTTMKKPGRKGLNRGNKGIWEPPPAERIKINVDGAFDAVSGSTGIGVVIRGADGKALLCSWRTCFNATSAEETEALAAQEGIRLAAEWCPEKSVLEVDYSITPEEFLALVVAGFFCLTRMFKLL
ncbi:hypothetical protein PR202_ga28002 [Eleusine coracana subsp. coracana]|uniref:RNase H type-1 domain-containing protein n=1 Tax=Eleusine coracana subsp. coracana TaxID=191504 RepID=A0AAV5DHP8_ELECO|nr:hypothetical protein PR202_ga28002 [Eleusine coracana subsp. coracana]